MYKNELLIALFRLKNYFSSEKSRHPLKFNPNIESQHDRKQKLAEN